MFEVLKRNGLARTGKWLIEEQDKEVGTPNILFLNTDRIKAPQEAEVLIVDSEIPTDWPYIKSGHSLFSISDDNIDDYTVSPYLVYPPSQKEINDYAAKLNKDNITSKVFVVAGKDESIADSVSDVDAEVFVLPNAPHLITRPRSFVNTLVNLRESIGYQRMIYTPGLGTPSHIALLLYCGVDLIDSIPLVLNARLGYFLFTHTKLQKEDITEDICFCPACREGKKDYESILAHNYYAALSELKTVRNTIHLGQLRELVEARVRAEPWMVSVLRILDRENYPFLERNIPVSGGSIIATTNDSLQRPVIIRFRNRVRDRYKKPQSKKVLLLLPCSAKKPYSFSKTHRIIRSAFKELTNRHVIHDVVITSPLGVVPMEVELFYPAQNYDIPVTRTWSKDEISMIQEGISEFLKKNRYDGIVVYLPEDYKFVGEVLDDHTNTCIDTTTSSASLEKLKEVLNDLVLPYDKIGAKKAMRESMDCFARFQFGIAGEKLVKDAEIKGRYPNLRIIRDGVQIGMLVGDRGMISLTLEGGKILAEENSYRVKIHDFQPKGSIFAVGVKDSDDEIRIGDDVVVLRDNELVGVGVAQMNPDEMIESERGEAVRIRHLVKSK
ncbi:MAG: DUF5591 domain-containing protein [Thermoplasmata archaeon]|nr:MAG: DUF5591 domain-containing protein [Thermoplasmata archaeon]